MDAGRLRGEQATVGWARRQQKQCLPALALIVSPEVAHGRGVELQGGSDGGETLARQMPLDNLKPLRMGSCACHSGFAALHIPSNYQASSAWILAWSRSKLIGFDS